MARILALAAALSVATITVAAGAQAPVRSERVSFPRGASSTSIRGTVRGYDSVDYLVSARAGQTLTASLRTTNRSAYFNVLPPRSPEAIFIGSTSGSQFEGRLPQDGDYRIRVYLMRNAARRGEQAGFTLALGVTGRPGAPGAGVPGPGGPGGAGPGGPGGTRPVAAGNMAAFCRGEAAQQYGTRPNYVTVGRVVPDRGGSAIDGSVDQGRQGIKRFRCRFDARNRFIDVMAMTRDGF